jgi:hypothetical protein
MRVRLAALEKDEVVIQRDYLKLGFEQLHQW